MIAVRRNHVTFAGNPDGPPMLLAHGFGCDQGMWRDVVPAFADRYRIVLFDHVGAGASDPTAFDPTRYSELEAYAEDVVHIVDELDLHDVVLVGHSVSATIGALAVAERPDRFARLVLVCPSPRFIDDPAEGYVGGFSRQDIDELLESLESNYLGWSSVMAPVVMGNGERPELGEELTSSFCRTDPAMAAAFARATFLADNRADLARVSVPSLVLQTAEDAIAPPQVGRYVADHIPDSTFVMLDAVGHCPHMSAPEETVAAIRSFLTA